MRTRTSSRSTAIAIAADTRALVPVVGLLLSVLALILTRGVAWLHVT